MAAIFSFRDFIPSKLVLWLKTVRKMSPKTAFLMALIIICPFRSSLDDSADFEDDSSDVLISDDEPETDLPGHCAELRDKPNVNFVYSDKLYSVSLKPQDSVLNPFKPVRVFNGFDFRAAVEAHDFVPCLVRGSAEEDGRRVDVYGNVFNGTFNGFAIIGGEVHHIRNADLWPAPRHSRALKANGGSLPLFAKGFPIWEPAGGSEAPEVLRKKPPPKKPPPKKKPQPKKPDPKVLYAKDCPLKLIADHTFHRDVGGGDVGMTLSFMTHYVQRADALFRQLDLQGGQGLLSSQVGLRVRDRMVFEEDASPSVYPLRDEALTSAQVLRAVGTLKDPGACYVLLFTARRFLENSAGRSYGWSNSTGNATFLGGVCAASKDNGRLPNAGFVSVTSGTRRLTPRVAVVAVARVLALAFGASVDASNVSCPVAPGRVNVMGSYFPPPADLWPTVDAGFSECSLKAMRRVLARRAGCFVHVMPEAESRFEDYLYYSVSGAPDFEMAGFGLMLMLMGMLEAMVSVE